MTTRNPPNPELARFSWVSIGLLVLLVLATLVPVSPPFQPVPPDDAGVFVYVAQRWLDGDVPYRDVWDHKPPAIYAINVLGLLLAGGSFWGVWALELLAVLSAALLGFFLLRALFGLWPALFGSVLWVLSLGFVIQSGHYTEIFALPLQFAALILFYEFERRGMKWWIGMLWGITGAAAFLLRQNLIGVWAALAIYLLVHARTARPARELATLGLFILPGAAGIIAPVIVYFAAQGVLGDFWDAAFVYNFTYVATPLFNRVDSLRDAWKHLAQTGSIFFAGSAWIASLYLLTSQRTKTLALNGPVWAMIRLSLILFPIEVALSLLSSQTSRHYFIASLPILAILCAEFGLWLLRLPDPFDQQQGSSSGGFASIFLMLLLVSSSLSGLDKLHLDLRPLWEGLDVAQEEAVIEYVSGATQPEDYVLVWGHRAGYLFVAERVSPSRFAYFLPVHPARPDYMPELLDDLRDNTPTLIVDGSRRVPIDTLSMSAEFEALGAFIEANYEIAETLGPEGWPVYRYVGGEN